MIVHETAIHQMTVESKLPQVQTITEAVKSPEIQNVKLFIKHDNRLHLLKKW